VSGTTPTGTVTFKDGASTLGTGTLNGSGDATFSTSILSVGSHSITAVYGGDSNFNGSTSSSLTQTVNKADTSVGLGAAPNPTYFRQSVTFTATVTPNPTGGGLTFKDGATDLACSEGAQPRLLNGSGSATCTTSALSVGSHSITAVYSGDSNYNGSTSFTVVQVVNSAPVIISEFRFAGPGGSTDEFIELYNTTNAPYDINGYQLVFSDGSPALDIPANTELIPARGHFLIANNSAQNFAPLGKTRPGRRGPGVKQGDTTADLYSLSLVASPDLTYTFDVSVTAGVLLQSTGGNAFVLDSVGFTNTVPQSFVEGTGLAPTASFAEYSYARKIATTGFPQDTDNNANDFWLVATNTTAVGDATAVLGAPGPENLSSPVNKTSQLKSSLLKSDAASTADPNQVRDTTPGDPGAPTEFGTLTLRRYFTNTMGAPVSTLRIRISNITTTNSPGAGPAQADVRALTSIPQTITVNGVDVAVRMATLESPATTPPGGGYNVTLLVDLSALPGGVLANNEKVAVNITLGVAKGGTYRLAYTVEAATTF
jgi:hypothetical protein